MPLLLKPHPTARTQAVSSTDTHPGDLILSAASLSSVLLPENKGRRCDFCHKSESATGLRKCSGCASYWYCDATCQSLQWKAHHRKICKSYNKFIASPAYQALASHERLDAMLLSHLLAQHQLSESADGTEYETMMSLMPGPSASGTLPTCPPRLQAEAGSLTDVYSRFGNNNFAIHSHLVTYGHGIFPLASRYFNHSCYPNAAARFIITAATPVRMEVVALRDIPAGQEICLTYVDPALSQTRHKIFQLTYGFNCACSSCKSLLVHGNIQPPPKDTSQVDSELRRLIFPQAVFTPLPYDNSRPLHVPPSLSCVYHESYLSNLSERFSKASHNGSYDEALDLGVTLLAVYVVLYPPHYPQIGMHLLELAKTAWNTVITNTTPGSSSESAFTYQARVYLRLAQEVLSVFGREGDPEGPFGDIRSLHQMLEE